MAQDMADAMFDLLEAQGYFDEAAAPPCEGVEMVPKRVRRGDEELRATMDRIVAVLQERGEPLPISAVAKELDVPPRSLSHPLARLVAERRILRTGARRGARYLTPPGPRRRRKKGGPKGAPDPS